MSTGRAEQLRILEAVLFAASEPCKRGDLMPHLSGDADLDGLLGELQQLYAGRGVELQRIGDGWAFRTAPDLAGRLRLEQTVTRKLTRAALETLAIIAYHQPVTRAEIEEIRGVGLSKGTLDTLLEAGWVRPRGRRQTPGRPVTWCTTDGFLDHFGLSSLQDLPGVEELKAAGLLDTRPALTALTARGELGEASDGGAGGTAQVDEPDTGTDGEEPLAADFGAELLDDDTGYKEGE